ncbi:FecCD family ABC transporter permease [Sediminispirochaeta bajacaliforniensis]|uniref:FecCD family ABC transporter permease n=1 Tax=Sediminispirochaeta bajacaliforniensis TaxID=148 RepID=UPI000372552E|nr:iron ABC transporter permease [Sediminispirochaeta bajacaliforniensis]
MTSKSKSSAQKLTMIVVLLLILVVGTLWALTAGTYDISAEETYHILRTKLMGGSEEELSKLHTVIIWTIRTPRVLLAIITGVAFALSGAAYQACFRNPLVEPYILGVSAGAAFGAALGIMFPTIIRSMQLSAFGFAILAVALSYAISKTRGRAPVITLVISGVVIGSLFSAMVSLLKYLAPDAQLREITFWMMGGFYYATWKDVILTAPFVAVVFAIIFLTSWKLNILSMGDEEARTLGVHPERYRLLYILSTTLVTALCVSQVGIVAWVGLMAPHAARMIFGADNSYVVPAGALLGALFILLCDTMARTIASSEIPIGILTSVVGAPFLIYLLRSKGKTLYG